jgi:FkbM family methyltransferase
MICLVSLACVGLTNHCEIKRLNLNVGNVELRSFNRNMADVTVVTQFGMHDDVMYYIALPHPCIDAHDFLHIPSLLADGPGHHGLGMGGWYPDLLMGAPNGSTMLDVGANLGMLSVPAAILGLRVVAVEAQTRLADRLRITAKANGWSSRMSVFNQLVGRPEQRGTALVCTLSDTSLMLMDNDKDEHCKSVQQSAAAVNTGRLSSAQMIAPFTTIDELVPAPEVVYFWKMDCDGCEPGAYAGAQNVLSEGRVRFLHVELQSKKRDGAWIQDLVQKHRPLATYIMDMGPACGTLFAGRPTSDFNKDHQPFVHQLLHDPPAARRSYRSVGVQRILNFWGKVPNGLDCHTGMDLLFEFAVPSPRHPPLNGRSQPTELAAARAQLPVPCTNWVHSQTTGQPPNRFVCLSRFPGEVATAPQL